MSLALVIGINTLVMLLIKYLNNITLTILLLMYLLPMYYVIIGLCHEQGWGQVQLTKYSSTPSTPNICQVQVLGKYSFF